MRSRRTRRLLLLAALVGTLATTAGPATATGLGFTISPTVGPPGTAVSFSGTGCPHADGTDSSHTDGTFELFDGLDTNQGALLARVRFSSNADGTFDGSTSPLPSSALGAHRTDVACDDGTIAAGPDFVMTAGASVTTTTSPSRIVYRFSPRSGPRGTTVDVVGVGCPPGQHDGADNSVDGRLYLWKGTNTAEGPFMLIKAFDALDSVGRFHFTFTIPDSPDILVGDHRSLIVCTGGEVVGATFTVTESPAPTTTSTTVMTLPAPVDTVIGQIQAAVDQQAMQPETAAVVTLFLNFLQHLFGG